MHRHVHTSADMGANVRGNVHRRPQAGLPRPREKKRDMGGARELASGTGVRMCGAPGTFCCRGRMPSGQSGGRTGARARARAGGRAVKRRTTALLGIAARGRRHLGLEEAHCGEFWQLAARAQPTVFQRQEFPPPCNGRRRCLRCAASVDQTCGRSGALHGTLSGEDHGRWQKRGARLALSVSCN